MATKSFLKQITIKDRKSCEALVNALESAVNKKYAQIDVPKPAWATAEDIKKMSFARKV